MLFPNYDGIGLSNFACLYQRIRPHAPCQLFLMPDWQKRLARFGNPEVWRNTREDFDKACHQLEAVGGMTPPLYELIEALRRRGCALEQEAIWLPVD